MPLAHDDFFTSPQMKQWWKDYAYVLANRVNTFTGIAYKDEPAILAWEIGNELRCPSCRGSSKLPDAVRELAAFLRQVAPNQLISDVDLVEVAALNQFLDRRMSNPLKAIPEVGLDIRPHRCFAQAVDVRDVIVFCDS